MSSQNRVDPFQILPETGLGGRWPKRWTSVEGSTRLWPSGFRVYPILAIALLYGVFIRVYIFQSGITDIVYSITSAEEPRQPKHATPVVERSANLSLTPTKRESWSRP